MISLWHPDFRVAWLVGWRQLVRSGFLNQAIIRDFGEPRA